MMEQFLSTSRLVNVIQLIALGKQTGVLKAVRGLGSTREQGEIHFVAGQPTFAVLGHLVGNAALTVLQNWGESQYIFLEGPLPQPERAAALHDPLGRPGETASPQPGPLGRPTARLSPTPTRQTAGLPPFSTPFPFHRGTEAGNVGNRNTGNLSYRGSETFSEPLPAFPSQRNALQGQFVPRRLASMDRLENLPLDRRERMVLLLVDGQRNLSDLSRLTRRTERELLAVLDYLAGLGLVELRS